MASPNKIFLTSLLAVFTLIVEKGEFLKSGHTILYFDMKISLPCPWHSHMNTRDQEQLSGPSSSTKLQDFLVTHTLTSHG